MNNNDNIEQSSDSEFLDRRLDLDFPWQAWIIGLLSIVKAVLWLVTEPPILSEEVLHILFYKYSIAALPFIIFGMGAWNLKKWAAQGILILCIAELLFFVFYPTSFYTFPVDTTSILSLIFSALVFLINGPASDAFILICLPTLYKHSGKKPK